jgi:DNA processing protein
MKLEPKSISLKDPRYPSLLKEIQNPPSRIYILGELPNEQKSRIAIVGTRKATLQGRSIAKETAEKLAEQGLVIVSGLAMGIDAAAHEGALEAKGKTIVVLANGLGKIYPARNQNLGEKVLECGGAIISEYGSEVPYFKGQFLKRNRIISGLCQAVIIIEAPQRSGSLATARLAAEQGREVFVVPGPINHPNYYGSHQLIRDGARLVSSIDDILEDLGINIRVNPRLNPRQSASMVEKITDENQLLVLKTIREFGQPINIDKIIELTKLEPQVINQSLALLVIQGMLKETEKGYTI